MLCNICYQEVDNGVIVPGFQKAAGICHEDCITEATLKIAADPSKEGLLRHLVEYEESRTPQDRARDISDGSADVCWEWTEVNIPYYRIRQLLDAGLVTVVFRTNRSTNYALVGRRIIKEALNTEEQTTEEHTETVEIPADLFSCIIGYEDIKEEIKFTLTHGKKNHYLLVGPPATAKSLFLMELGRLRATYSATGSRVTAAGLTDAFFNYKPNILLLDEIDKVSMDATAVLLSAMETGDILVTKYKTHQQLKLDLAVFAAGNTDRNVAPELLSRFDTKLYFSSYSFADFITICGKYLSAYEGVSEELAEYIGRQTWNLLDKDIRTARGIARQIREPVSTDVDRIVNFRKKYAKMSEVHA